jgi:hypothetical protein
MGDLSGSIAVWCEPVAHAQSEIEAHFNYWHLTGDAQFKPSDGSKVADFVEVGVLVDDPQMVESTKIYLPLKLDRSGLADCSQHFQETSIAQGIFNEVLRAAAPSNSGPQFIELSRANSQIFARVHVFALNDNMLSANELTLEDKGEGILLTITSLALAEAREAAANVGGRAYFRLRAYIRNDQSNPFIQSIATPDSHLQSSYDEIEYLDFRVNEARTLPTPIQQAMRIDRRSGSIQLKLIAFLTAIPVTSELTVSNTPSHKMRLLEHSLWKKYAPGGIPEGMMVYHWKRDTGRGVSLSGHQSSLPTEVTDFTAFVKLITRRSSKKIWQRYLIIAFAIGLLGNLVAGVIQSLFEKHPISVTGLLAGGKKTADVESVSSESSNDESSPAAIPDKKNVLRN